MISARRAWTLTGLWALFIFGLSSIPGKALPTAQLFTSADKLAHLAVYAVLGALTFVSARKTWTASTPSTVLLSAILAACYGAGDEIHQRFVPARSADVLDVAADGVGAVAGALAAAWAYAHRAG
jgi:VanZ family protein